MGICDEKAERSKKELIHESSNNSEMNITGSTNVGMDEMNNKTGDLEKHLLPFILVLQSSSAIA